MSNIKRVVSTSFWEDDKVVDSFTPEDKYFMLYLLTNPHTTQLGIYPLNIKMAAFETGYSKDSVSYLLDRFENVHKIIKRSDNTTEIAIKNSLCYSVVRGGKPVLDCLYSEVKQVRDKSLLVYVVKNLLKRTDVVDTVSSFAQEMAKQLNIENDNENDNDNDNENENENESTGDVTSHVTSDVPKPDRPKIDFDKIKEYFNTYCTGFSAIREMTDARKKTIKSFLKNHSESDLYMLFDTAQKSDFLTGNNTNGWTASFDWIIKPSNAVKILEGNYNNRAKKEEDNIPETLKGIYQFMKEEEEGNGIETIF